MAWDADKWANTKTGSIYHALRQLGKEGLLEEFDVPATAAAPARTDYAITETGDAEFHRLMEKALTVPEMRPDMLCAGLVLMSALPRAEVLGYLRERLGKLVEQREDVAHANRTASFTGERPLPAHVEALLSFWTSNTTANHDWLEGLIGKIEGGAYIFADEDENAFGSPTGKMVVP
jgi:DNA-binding PadR family transcriptional regulator